MKASLSAYSLTDSKDWLDRLPGKLEAAGFESLKKRSSLEVWRSSGGRGNWEGQAYSDGWVLKSFWVGPGFPAIAVTLLRCYFNAEGARDPRQEMEIVSSRPPANIEKRMEDLDEFLGTLEESAPEMLGGCLQLGECFSELGSDCRLVSGETTAPLDSVPKELYIDAGFDRIPADFEVSVVGAEGVHENITGDFCSWLRKGYKKRGCTPTVGQFSLSKVEERLDELVAGDEPVRKKVVVVLVLGPRRQPVSDRMTKVMGQLDRCRLPWRRAHSDDPMRHSVEDQLGSILEAAGGCSHRVLLSGGEQLPWSIGVDLSHPGGSKPSVLCVALVDPGGRFVHAWTSHHRRDETIDQEVMRPLISAALGKVREKDSNAGVLLLRDGRMFEKEEPGFYLDQMDGQATLVELRKYNNPPLLVGSPPRPPRSPVFALASGVAKGRQVGFLVTLPKYPRSLNKVLKVHWEDGWDGLELGAEKIAQILLALTYTSILGRGRSFKPSPIYWADGIAGASDEDQRFRGRPVTHID